MTLSLRVQIQCPMTPGKYGKKLGSMVVMAIGSDAVGRTINQ
jgi:hypothetical protein